MTTPREHADGWRKLRPIDTQRSKGRRLPREASPGDFGPMLFLIEEIRHAASLGLNVAFRRDPRCGGLAMQVYEDPPRVGGRWLERVIPPELLGYEESSHAEFYFGDSIRSALAAMRPAAARKVFDDPASVPIDYQI